MCQRSAVTILIIMNCLSIFQMVTDGDFAHGVIKSALRYNGTKYFYYYDHLNERSFNEVWGESIFMKYLGEILNF